MTFARGADNKLEELKKGCKKLFGSCRYEDMNPYPCGTLVNNKLRICEDCQIKLGGFKEGLIAQIDDELNFLIAFSHDARSSYEFDYKKIYISEGHNLVEWIDKRIELLQQKKKELSQ